MKGSKNLTSKERVGGSQIRLCRSQTRRALLVCDQIEALADRLPDQSIREWRIVQLQCRTVLGPYFEVLNEVTLPKMLRQSNLLIDRWDLLARFKSDCLTQIHALTDLDDMISDVLLGQRYINEPEALGFALRCIFEPMRRDLHWQFDVLWPLADRTWSEQDAQQFLDSLGD